MQILSHMLIRSRAVVVVAVLVSLLAGCALPLASESELETESDKQFAKMRAELVVSNDAQTRAYVNCVSAAVIRQLERPYSDKEWDVEVFESEDINAFAMPGGHIGVYTGILNVAENQDQLATVIGHEVAHVTRQHALNRVNREMTTQAGVIAGSAVLGGGQAAGQLLSMGAQLGLSLPYGRAQESDADVVGLKYMAAAGFNPQQSIQLWKNMAKKSKLGPAPFLSTHPSGDTRIQDLIEQLPSALKLYNAAQAAGKRPVCR
ncbi:MAG: M48 family metallopeptidase [Gammaproteobacteria bacterium]